MLWQPEQPYNSLPDLPPNVELETHDVLKATIEARAALAQLDQASRLLPYPGVLLSAIPLLEAQASSEIENVVTTADDLFKHAQAEASAADPATKETLRYRVALQEGLHAVRKRPLTALTAARVCTVIKSRTMQVRDLPGTRIANPATGGQVAYAPPEGETVINAKLANWEKYVHTDDGVDPLVRMAVAHYQFEAIHPYDDGNGRTGRILNILLLVSAGLLSQPILFLSRYIIENRADYYRLLLAVTADGNWEEWVRYMVEGVRQTALSTVQKIDAIMSLQDSLRDRIKEATPGGRNSDFTDVLFELPYVRIPVVVSRCGVSRPTATAWLNALVAAGVLTDHRLGRDRLFLNEPFFDVLVRHESID